MDKVCFAHDAAYSYSTDLAKRTVSDKILIDRAYEIAINCKYDGYQRGLASMVYKFFDKKTGSGANVKEVLPQELHKPVIIKFKRRKVYPRFKDNIWAAALHEMGLDKKVKTVLNGFIGIVNQSKQKPYKLWVVQGREFYNSLMQKWSDDNILLHSTHNEGKSVVNERFLKTLTGKIYKKMAATDSKS